MHRWAVERDLQC